MHIQLNENVDFGFHFDPATAGQILTNSLNWTDDLTIDSSACISGGAVGSTYSYTVNTGTASVGSALCTCFNANGTGIGVVNPCPVHGTLTVTSPNQWIPATSPNWTFTYPQIEDKCYICRDAIKMEEILEGHKTCRDCRRAVEAFKAVLVCEDEEKE